MPGMWLLIREASAARNLRALIPLALEYGPSRIAFCTDDREPEHIADDGHVNSIVRDAVALGVPPEDALVMASLNPALYHGLRHLGAIAPGYQADVLVLPDLESFVPELVLKAGRPVGGDPLRAGPGLGAAHGANRAGRRRRLPDPVAGRGGTCDRARPGPDRDGVARRRADASRTARRRRPRAGPGEDRRARAAPRHRPLGLGFVRGFGLARGAFGATLATTRTTSIVVGVDDGAMATSSTAWSSSEAGSSSPTRRGSRPSCRCRSPGSSPTGRSRRCSRRAARSTPRCGRSASRSRTRSRCWRSSPCR